MPFGMSFSFGVAVSLLVWSTGTARAIELQDDEGEILENGYGVKSGDAKDIARLFIL